MGSSRDTSLLCAMTRLRRARLDNLTPHTFPCLPHLAFPAVRHSPRTAHACGLTVYRATPAADATTPRGRRCRTADSACGCLSLTSVAAVAFANTAAVRRAATHTAWRCLTALAFAEPACATYRQPFGFAERTRCATTTVAPRAFHAGLPHRISYYSATPYAVLLVRSAAHTVPRTTRCGATLRCLLDARLLGSTCLRLRPTPSTVLLVSGRRTYRCHGFLCSTPNTLPACTYTPCHLTCNTRLPPLPHTFAHTTHTPHLHIPTVYALPFHIRCIPHTFSFHMPPLHGCTCITTFIPFLHPCYLLPLLLCHTTHGTVPTHLAFSHTLARGGCCRLGLNSGVRSGRSCLLSAC